MSVFGQHQGLEYAFWMLGFGRGEGNGSLGGSSPETNETWTPSTQPTTYYVGDYFEWTGATSTMVKYYSAGGSRVAMRIGSSTVYYLLADHLGGTNVTVTTTGVENGELRYRAFGDTRYSSGTTPTTFRYTGQREEQSLGLYFYNARFYDPYLNRWIQPDTIIPDPGNPLDYDRFAYVRNNPLKYVDPTGHFSDEEITGFFGVETWDDVLAYFQDGGAYEGKWGWLGFLKAAQDGSTYDWTSNAGFQYDFFEMTTARSQMEHHGSLSIVDGRLVFGESEELSMFTVLQEGNFAALDGLVWETNRDPVKFLKFDSSNVDWGDTAYDATSLGLSVFGLGTATKWKDLAKGAREISSIMSGAGAAESLTVNQYTDTLLGVGGALPWPLVSVPCSIASVYFDLEPGFYWGP